MTQLKYVGKGLISQGTNFTPDFNDGLFTVEDEAAKYLQKTFKADFILIEKNIKAPVKKTPDEEAPVKKTPDEEAPVKKTPDEEAPVKKTPVEEAPVKKTPVEEAPVEEAKNKTTR